MLLSKYKRKPEAWNKHVVPYFESEATSSPANTTHPFQLIPWMMELDSSTGVWKLLSFLRLPSRDGSLSLPLFSLFLSFIFFPTSFWRQWAAFLGAWCPLPTFRSCFVEFAQHSNVLVLNLLGRKWSPHLILLPSWDCLLLKCVNSRYILDINH